MAKIAKRDIEFANKGKRFILYLMDVKYIKHTSIGRASSIDNAFKIKSRDLSAKAIMRILKAYSNNYKEWCSLNGYEVEEELLDYLKKLYE